MGKINPWDFLPPGRSAKLAKECTELHCAKQNADGLGDEEEWEKFPNLEVLWINDNLISRIANIESCFRIRELYVHDNRLVSLNGLHTFKFLNVLCASNNQLRNLDKQLGVLKRFAFLKHLDLIDNPVAEEPDYRLRVIYHLPQIEQLDLKAVKNAERLVADEVVPNMNTVSSVAPGDVTYKPKQKWVDTKNEKWTFACAAQIRERWRLAEEEALRAMYEGLGGLQKRDYGDEGLLNNANLRLQDYRKNRVEYEKEHLNEWEKIEVTNFLKEACGGKTSLTKEEFIDIFLTEDSSLSLEGRPISRVIQLGESLGKVPDPTCFDPPAAIAPTGDDADQDAEDSQKEDPLSKLPANSLWQKFTFAENPPKIELQALVNYFCSEELPWNYEADESLAERIAFLYSEAKKQNISGHMDKAQDLSRVALRLEGIKTRKVTETKKKRAEKNTNLRGDYFEQIGLVEYLVTDKKGKERPRCAIERSSYYFLNKEKKVKVEYGKTGNAY